MNLRQKPQSETLTQMRYDHRHSQGGHGPSHKFLAYLVILCFEKWRPKQKHRFPPKANILLPQKNLGWLRHGIWLWRRLLIKGTLIVTVTQHGNGCAE